MTIASSTPFRASIPYCTASVIPFSWSEIDWATRVIVSGESDGVWIVRAISGIASAVAAANPWRAVLVASETASCASAAFAACCTVTHSTTVSSNTGIVSVIRSARRWPSPKLTIRMFRICGAVAQATNSRCLNSPIRFASAGMNSFVSASRC